MKNKSFLFSIKNNYSSLGFLVRVKDLSKKMILSGDYWRPFFSANFYGLLFFNFNSK
jgi:hypothetical protein